MFAMFAYMIKGMTGFVSQDCPQNNGQTIMCFEHFEEAKNYILALQRNSNNRCNGFSPYALRIIKVEIEIKEVL
jgi:hypothetical protein